MDLNFETAVQPASEWPAIQSKVESRGITSVVRAFSVPLNAAVQLRSGVILGVFSSLREIVCLFGIEIYQSCTTVTSSGD